PPTGGPSATDAGPATGGPSAAGGPSSAGGPSRASAGPSRASAGDRPVIPGERRFRDGDRVRHPSFGEGIVVSSKLTRDDEEVTVAFRDASVGRKVLLASVARLERTG
ncbi:MAG TPA: hypothetical protein VNJ28_05715, partial [Candidatus Limnocylindrales bacterium]|nr:hypothetical protein [Candidatus Limnocylindrales bacterium]